MMFEGKHIHFSPVNKKPLCSYSAKLCKQRRINGYAFCIRHILEDKSAPFKQCAHVARYNKQNCTNPIPTNENREFCNSHMQVAGFLPKKERKIKKEKEKDSMLPEEGKLKFADRLKALLTKENSVSCNDSTMNSDDPYAFPDTAPDTENGCIAFSATPILRNAWICSQKNSPDIPTLDSPSRCELSNPKICPSSDPTKPKTNTPTLSKTMNRLHAKIVQNKLMDKQKKTQDASQSTIALLNAQLQAIGAIRSDPPSPLGCASILSGSSDSHSLTDLTKNEVSIKLEPIDDQTRSEDSVASVCILSPDPPSVSQADSRLSCGANSSCSSEKYFCERDKSSTPSDVSCSKDRRHFDKSDLNSIHLPENSKVPLALRKLQRVFKSRKKKEKYLFPPGLDSSESESSDSEGESNLLSQLSWFCAWDRRSSSSLQSMQSESRPAQHAQLKTELLRSYYQLCQLHALHRQERKRRTGLMAPLVEASRAYSTHTSELLIHYHRPVAKHKKPNKPTLTVNKTPEKRTCSFKHDDFSCSNSALPYTWHCKKHIMYNVDQLLFEHCTAKFADNTQCCVPVFDVCHELPLCFEHAKKRDNYNKMASEPKPKKARKKAKPSALTRPPKRGKKKKKPSSVRPTLSPSMAMPQPTNSHSDVPSRLSSSCSEPAKLVQAVVPTAAPEMSKDLNRELHPEMESDLDDFSPGAIDKTLDLPLDTAELANQASKLLEEHDFTEVLNKIPDDAFNDLFVDTRNGDYIPTREETEELERALAAVSKDVHMARESLAKLSSSTSGPDLEELERTIEIHSSLLGPENLTNTIDENTFADLSGHLNVISSSFSTSELNSFTQALSAMPLEQPNHLPVTVPADVPVTVPTDMAHHPHLLNGHSDVLHSLNMDTTFSINAGSATLDSKMLTNGMSNMYYNIGTTPSFNIGATSTAYNVGTTTLTDETASSMTNSNMNHWLLNSPELLALAYQNGYLVAPSMSGTKCQDFSSDISMVEQPMGVASSICNTENVICGVNEQPVHTLSISGRSASQSNTVKVIVQEGAS